MGIWAGRQDSCKAVDYTSKEGLAHQEARLKTSSSKIL